MSTSFSKLGIRSVLIDVLRKRGISTATPIQEKAIPVLMSGRDAIGQAQTGTGKTLAFVLPILDLIDSEKPQTQALIVTPTRELAIQITDEIKIFSAVTGANVLAAYGGQDVEGQIRRLKAIPQIIVATPGRLLDHLRRNTIVVSNISILVLDEADQMLNMGFLPEVEEIIEETPSSRQMMLFSATMSNSVRKLATQFMRNPVDIRIEGKQITLEGIKQIAVQTTDRGKLGLLIRMIKMYRPFLAVVFCRTKIRAKKLTASLIANGLNADELHGDLSQSKREQVMKRFRSADLQILVATDVAARGLDVEGVTHVFNYDIPYDAESYIHRIGRTGRAGQEGMAVTFLSLRDRQKLEEIERDLGMSIKRREMAEFVELNDKHENLKEKTGGVHISYESKHQPIGNSGQGSARIKPRKPSKGKVSKVTKKTSRVHGKDRRKRGS